MKYILLITFFSLSSFAKSSIQSMSPFCAKVKNLSYNARANILRAELNREVQLEKSQKTQVLYTKNLDDKYKLKMAMRNKGSLICINTIKKGKSFTHKMHLIQAQDLPYITKI